MKTLILLTLLSTVSALYIFNSTVTLRKKTFSNNYWISNGLSLPGYLIYMVKSIDNKSKVNTLIMNRFNYLRYEKNEAFTYYTEYSKFGVISSRINNTYFDQDDIIYLIVENTNLFSNADIKVLLIYQEVISPSNVPNTNPINLPVIIILSALGVLIILIIGIFIYKSRRREYIDLLGK